MKKVILNVDDFGLTDGVNQAVFKLHEIGVVNSTTALVNSPAFITGIEEAQKYPNLKIGIHLTIDLFNAEIYHPSLCDKNLKFHTSKTHDLKRPLDSNVVYQEWKSQIDKFIKITGMKPSHIDSHHHAHVFNSDANIAVTLLAKEYNLPVRQHKTTDYISICNGDFYDSGVSFESLKNAIEELLASDGQYLDVMMHPAFVTDELKEISSYNTMREKEYEVLSSTEFKDYIINNEIIISSY